MARSNTTHRLRPSVLDRLLDDAPESAREATPTTAQAFRDLKRAVRRDLENLLNTRWRCAVRPADLDELDVSMTNYGIPDFTGADLGSNKERESFRRTVETVVRKRRVQHVGPMHPDLLFRGPDQTGQIIRH